MDYYYIETYELMNINRKWGMAKKYYLNYLTHYSHTQLTKNGLKDATRRLVNYRNNCFKNHNGNGMGYNL